jgi:hypothetical protein
MQPERKIWFPAKKYGWGWGPPCAWQGWVVLVVWVAALILGATVFFRPNRHVVGFYVYEAIMIGALIAICWAKGETPKWRWGNK